MAAFEQGDERNTRAIAEEVDHICRAIGFLVIKDHGVDEAIIDGAWNTAREFFALPFEEKLLARDVEPGSPRGYAPALSETLARSRNVETAPDLKESFQRRAGAPAGPDARRGLSVLLWTKRLAREPA